MDKKSKKKYYKKTALFLGLTAVLLIGVHLYFENPRRSVRINGHRLLVLVADNEQERERGLGGAPMMREEEGMLFLFDTARPWAFWMKDMQFDLDIIWIRDDKIVFVARNVLKEPLSTVTPDTSADAVLEINAGLSDRWGFRVGDRVEF